ncbi:MAG: 50S ribosomal protein L6, partial [Gemmatimonadaceae bacterium]
MSRIGKLPVDIPAGVTVSVAGSVVTVKGPKGELKRTFNPAMTVAVDGAQVSVTRPSDDPGHKSLHGLSRTLLFNMIEGVTKGYVRQLEITGVGYKAEPKPYGLLFALGYSHQIEFKAPDGIKLTAPQPTT